MSFNEDTSFIEYNVEQPTQDFVTNFDTIGGATDVVLVTVDGVLTDTPESSYTVQQINHTTWRVTPEVPAGSVVRLYRVTNIDEMMHVFTAGAKFIARNMDNNFKQIRHAQQEVRDNFVKLKGDIGFTNLEQTVQAVNAVAVAVNATAAQVQEDKVDTELYASTAASASATATAASNAAQQAVIDVSNAEADVYSALSAQQVAVNNSLTAIAGGHKAYQTLEDAQAAQASLPANTVVEVTNDPTSSNNGTYQWNGTTLTKSAYDPLLQAKSYSDENRAFTQSVNVSTGDVTLTVAQARKDIIYFTGTLTANVTVTFPKFTAIYELQNATSGGFSVFVKTQDQIESPKEIKSGTRVTALNSSSDMRINYAHKADLLSPVFTGTPKAPTAAASTNDTILATTEFSQRAAKGIVEVDVSAGGTINLTALQMSYPLIRLVGTLTSNVTINFTAGLGKYTINNRTTGGFDTIIKGFNQSSAFVVIKPNYTEDVQLYTGVISKLQSETSIPIATSSTLGGVKIGTGLQVGADGTVNAVGGGGGAQLQRYVGKFNFGQNYAIGDVVEHGSGNYQVVIGVTSADTTPNLSSSYQKISHNLYSGANRTITTISQESTPAQQVDIPTFLDKTGRFCMATGGRYLGYSTNYGQSYDNYMFDLGANTSSRWIKQTEDGELLIAATSVVSGQSNIQKILKTSGWQSGGVLTFSVKKEHQRGGIYFADWGFSQHGAFVLIADYGNKATTSGQDYPRYVYLSKDYGNTFETVFDLGGWTSGVGVHLHGVCFDPYWNRIWVSFGDASFNRNGLLYSDDLGETWLWALETQNAGINFPQSVHIVALPTCILLCSDSYPNGIHRIDRAQGQVPSKGYYTVDAAYMIPDQLSSLNFLFHQVAKAEWLPDSPYIFVYGSEVNAGKSGAIATFNGWDFFQIWTDSSNNTAGFGGRSVIGVTPKNEVIIGTYDEARDGGWKKITLKVNLD